MSYKNPIIPSLTLKGVDDYIQAIQEDISFSWLSKSYGLADTLTNDEESYPAVFESNRVDPIILWPSDLHKAFCFWVKDAETEMEPEYGVLAPIIKYKVGCIFYVDIKRVSSDSYKETKTKLREDIHNYFNTLTSRLVFAGTVEDDMEAIYEGFTIENVDKIYKEYPKWAYRINFELAIRDSCYSLNTY
jgi:hypothetical protein